jgi:hypothetical protein
MSHTPGNMPYQPPEFRKWNKVGGGKTCERCITYSTSGRLRVSIWDGERSHYGGTYDTIEAARAARDGLERKIRPRDGRKNNGK